MSYLNNMHSTLKVSKHEFKTLAIIVLVAICAFLGVDIYLPSMPFIADFMHADKAQMQQSVSIYLLGTGASVLFYGPLSDKYGRRPIVIFGMVLATLASIAAAYTTKINEFLIIRLLQGVGAGVAIGIGRTMIADVLQGERYSVIGSYFGTFVTLSPLFAPVLGGYIQEWIGWRGNFFALAIILALVTIIYTCFCPETNKHKNPKAFSLAGLYKSYTSLLKHRTFMACTIISSFFMALTATYSTVSSYIFQREFHIRPVIYGWLTAIIMVAIIAGKIINGSYVQKIGMHKTLRIGVYSTFCFSAIFFGLSIIGFSSASLLVIIMLLICTCRGFVMGNCSALALSYFHKNRGSAAALFGGLQMLVAFVVSAIAGSFTNNAVIVLSATYVLITLGSVLAFILMLRKHTHESH